VAVIFLILVTKRQFWTNFGHTLVTLWSHCLEELVEAGRGLFPLGPCLCIYLSAALGKISNPTGAIDTLGLRWGELRAYRTQIALLHIFSNFASGMCFLMILISDGGGVSPALTAARNKSLTNSFSVSGEITVGHST
jgi:hypothetical protein